VGLRACTHIWVDGVKYPCEIESTRARFTAGGAAATQNFLSRRGEAVWRNNPSQGDNVAPAEVTTAKWQSENVGESEVGW